MTPWRLIVIIIACVLYIFARALKCTRAPGGYVYAQVHTLSRQIRRATSGHPRERVSGEGSARDARNTNRTGGGETVSSLATVPTLVHSRLCRVHDAVGQHPVFSWHRHSASSAQSPALSVPLNVRRTCLATWLLLLFFSCWCSVL